MLLLCAASALLSGQGRDAFLGVPRFRGTMVFTAVSAGAGIDGGRYSFTADARATFILERLTSGVTPTWAGRMISSSSSFSFQGDDVIGFCTVTEKSSVNGPLQQGVSPENYDVRIRLNRENWEFSVAAFYGPRTTIDRVITCPSNPALNRTEKYQGGLSIPRSITELAYPSSGQTFRIESTFTGNVGYGTYVRPETITWKYSLLIEPDAGDLTLELTSSGWEKWRPEANHDGSAGPALEVTATVRNANGTPAPEDVQSFEWELADTSREPGVAINWPTEAKVNDKTEFDLRFEPRGDQVAETPDNQKMVRPVRNTAEEKAVIKPYDWGGWSTLKVTAVLRGGRRLTGRFKGASEDHMRLPKRKPDSLIAESWLEQWNLSGKPDESDDDEDPKGDGNAGDGLTLYEEYRGFYENRRHGEGNPKRKDYFAVNKAGSEVDAGLEHFRRLTGLRVHPQMLRVEMTFDRVINGNYSSSPHRVDQHAVVFQNAGYKGLSRAVGGPSNPQGIEYVGLQTRFPGRPAADPEVDYTTATIAHEALHTVNVWHHGRGDKEVFWSGATGLLPEDGAAIRALDEDGKDITADKIKSLSAKGEHVTLGVEGGQHSGVEDCVRRYDNAIGYLSKSDPKARYVTGGETPGAQLCDGVTGTGVNAPGRNSPQPRFGDAKIGNCKSQILVNDRITPPKR